MDEAELRAAIRAVILEELGEEDAAPARGSPVVEEVAIGTDAELAALVQRVAALARTPEGWESSSPGDASFASRAARRRAVRFGRNPDS